MSDRKYFLYGLIALFSGLGFAKAQVPSWSIQLEGRIVPLGKIYHIVDLHDCGDFDLGRLKQEGSKPIAFVTAQFEGWRPDKKDFPKEVKGKKISGGEFWVDPDSDTVKNLMKARISLASEKGYHGIVFDRVNFNGRKTGFDNSSKAALNYIQFLIKESHAQGLKFGLKGASEFLTVLKDEVDFFVIDGGLGSGLLKEYSGITKPIFNCEYDETTKSANDFPNVYSIAKLEGMDATEKVLSTNGQKVTPNPLLAPDKIVTWSIQYEGKIVTRNKDYHVVDLFEVSDADLNRLKEQGTKPIAYFSSQYENWRPDKRRFPIADIGKNLDDWEGERWINPNSKPIRELMIDRIRMAKKRGFYGIDVDNVDFYHFETGFDNSKNLALEYIRFFITEAKKHDLKFSLKNATDLAYMLRNEVDFYQNEEGLEYNELYKYAGVGKPVFNIEYQKPKEGFYFPGIYSIYKSDYKMDGREEVVYPKLKSKCLSIAKSPRF